MTCGRQPTIPAPWSEQRQWVTRCVSLLGGERKWILSKAAVVCLAQRVKWDGLGSSSLWACCMLCPDTHGALRSTTRMSMEI
jgi:hypothetical protein